MTALAETPDFVPARELPNGEYVYSPLGIFEFQSDGIAEAYLRTEPGGQSGIMAVWDTGIGKTWLAMGLAAYLFEDRKIDLVMVVAERNKIIDWRDDFERATNLQTHLYHGTGRQKRLTKAGTPHVFVTTYETGRNELMQRVATTGRGKARADGPLVDVLGLRGKRILWVFDEVPKVKNRGSEMHQAYAYILGALRKGPHHQRVLGLTATPVERDFGDAYNQARIVCPEKMPTVAQFEETFTQGTDDYGHYVYRQGVKPLFAQLFRSLVMRKRKTDADVVDQFPAQVEEAIHVTLAPDHAKFYEAVVTLLEPADGEDDDRDARQLAADTHKVWTPGRMTAGHPASHLHAPNEISQQIVESVGEAGLRSITSSKTEELLVRLKPLIKGQGAQAVIFTFFGGTVLKELAKELRKAGYTVGEYHGGKTVHANQQAKESFVTGQTELLLTSDAGSRGLNLGNAEYVIEYESALTYAKRLQRINRAHRIDSEHPIVTCWTMIADGTVEERIIDTVLNRNEDHDLMVGDEDDGSSWISAAERRTMLAVVRKRRS